MRFPLALLAALSLSACVATDGELSLSGRVELRGPASGIAAYLVEQQGQAWLLNCVDEPSIPSFDGRLVTVHGKELAGMDPRAPGVRRICVRSLKLQQAR